MIVSFSVLLFKVFQRICGCLIYEGRQWADVRIKIMINNLYISMNEEKIKELPVSGSPV